MPLKELTAFVAACRGHYKTRPGLRLLVHQWNYTDGNQPDADHPTLRAALDAASTEVQIQLLGNDGRSLCPENVEGSGLKRALSRSSRSETPTDRLLCADARSR